MAEEETQELVAAAKKAGKVGTMKKEEVDLPANVSEVMTGHLVDQAAHHEVLADAHKAAAENHIEHAAIHKAISEHFKKAAEEGGEHEEHHAMHADAHKAIADHHEFKAEHHMAMHKAHSEQAVKCAKAAEEFADTPEKKSAMATQLKAARDAKPVIKRSATPPIVDVTNMSTSEKTAFDSVQAAWLNSSEYKQLTTDALRAQTVAKLNSASNRAAVVVGVDGEADIIYRVDRPGMAKSGDGDEELTGATKLFDYIK
jgi:hypothetical protein